MATVVTKTIKPGGGGDYTTLAAALTANAGNLVSLDRVLRLECYAGDAGQLSPTGYTTDATRRIEVVAAPTDIHTGVWDTSHARITLYTDAPVNGGSADLYVFGMQVNSRYSSTGSKTIFERCVLTLNAAANGRSCAEEVAACINCIMYAFGGSGTSGVWTSSVSTVVSNCTAVGLAYGYRRTGGDITVKNCITQNCTDGFSGTFSAASDYNISDIAGDAPGTHSKTGVVQFVDAAAKDYHLSPADTVARGAGVNLTASGITTDIDGDARPATGAWDIGADQVAESPTPTPGGGRKPWGRDPWGRPAFGSAMCGWRHP